MSKVRISKARIVRLVRRKKLPIPILDVTDDEDQTEGVLPFNLRTGRPTDSDGLCIEDELVECSRRGDPDCRKTIDRLIPSVEIGRR